MRTSEAWLEKRLAMASSHVADQGFISRDGDGARFNPKPPVILAEDLAAPDDLEVLAPDGSYGTPDEAKTDAAGKGFGAEGTTRPDPREVSLKLMAREGEAVKADGLNVLAAAWIQFQTHDWFASDDGEEAEGVEPAIEVDDPGAERGWAKRRAPDRAQVGGGGKRPPPRRYRRKPTSLRDRGRRWWDARQVYGASVKEANALRTWKGGKLKIGKNGLLPLDPRKGIAKAGFNDNWWIALSALHHLFVKEHNHICEQLAQRHPDFNDDKLYDTARLCISALMAKIHTQWKAAIQRHKHAASGPPTSWRKAFSEGGTSGGKTDHGGVPYTLPEDFTSVYRLHPFMLDSYSMRSHEDDRKLATKDLSQVSGKRVRDAINEVGMANAIYSMGTEPPGAPRLHNCPKLLQELRRDDGEVQDMVAADIALDRQHGVPRYNDFRELVGLSRAPTFSEITPDVTWQQELQDVYGDVDSVDLMAGMLAEPPPAGSSLSETAMRLLDAMAPVRLSSREVCTERGREHVEETGMVDVLLRHYPELGPSLEGVDNAFRPWKRVG